MLSGRQLLQLPLASSVNDRCSSSSGRESLNFPHQVLRWENHRAKLAEFYDHYEFGQQTNLNVQMDKLELVCERSVVHALYGDIHRRVNRVLEHERPGRSWINGDRLLTREGYQNSRQSDGALRVKTNGIGRAIAVVEWKNPVILKIGDDLALSYNSGLARVQHPVGQLTEYTLMTGCRYAMLSSYCVTWFVRGREVNGEVVLAFSDALLFDTQNPSVNEAVFHLSMLAEMDEKEGWPRDGLRGQSYLTAPPQPTSRRPSLATLPVHGYRTRSKAKQGMAGGASASSAGLSLPIGSLSLGAMIGSGSGGVVVEGRYKGKNVAVKMLSPEVQDDPEYAVEQLETELAVYNFLSSLQGRILPKLHGYGQITAVTGHTALMLIMDRIEGRILRDLPLTPAIGKAAQSCLAAIHARGVAHGDMALNNMMLVAGNPPDNPKVVLLDFGKAVINASPYHIYQDIIELSRDFADKGIILEPMVTRNR